MPFFNNANIFENEIQTTDANWLLVTQPPCTANKTMGVILNIIARDTEDDDCLLFMGTGLYKRDGTAAIGSVLSGGIQNLTSPVRTLGAALWDCRALANTSNNSVDVEIKGQSGRTIDWFCHVEYFQIPTAE